MAEQNPMKKLEQWMTLSKMMEKGAPIAACISIYNGFDNYEETEEETEQMQ